MTTSNIRTLPGMAVSPSLARPIDQRSHSLRYVAAVVCAGSAGVHAALVPEHLRESTPLGVGFAAAAVLLAAAAILARRPWRSAWPMAAVAAVLVAVAVAYVLSRTVGIPLLVTDVELPDPVGVVTTCAEAVGASAAVVFLLQTRKDLR